MKRIAIISENFENDGKALQYLLEKRFSRPDYEIMPILKKQGRTKLSNLVKLKRLLDTNLTRSKKIDLSIVAIDLDKLPSDVAKIKEKQDWFEKFKKITDFENTFFLMIVELESLILADIETFNQIYKTKINFKGNPLFQVNPKEFLMEKTHKASKKYLVDQTPEIFKELDFQKVHNNHKGEISFQTFIDDLEKLL